MTHSFNRNSGTLNLSYLQKEKDHYNKPWIEADTCVEKTGLVSDYGQLAAPGHKLRQLRSIKRLANKGKSSPACRADRTPTSSITG